MRVINYQSAMVSDKRISRRAFIATSAVGLAGCSNGSDSSDNTDSDGSNGTPTAVGSADSSLGIDEVSVGALYAKSDTSSTLLVNGERQGMEHRKKKLEKEFDITINIHEGDTAAKTSEGLKAAKRLVNQNNVDVLYGGQWTLVQDQVGAWATRNNLFHMASGGHGDQTNNEHCAKYLFRFPPATTQTATAAGKSFADLETSKWFVLNGDYAWGQANLKAISTALENEGQEVVGNAASPAGTTDFSSELNKVEQSDAGGIIVIHAGADMTTCYKQLFARGMDKDYRLSNAYNEDGWIWNLDPEFIAKMGVTAVGWASGIQENDRVKTWMSEIKEEYDATAWHRHMLGRESIDQLIHAIVRADSTDPEDLRTELEGHDFSDRALLDGKHYWREWDHQAIRPVYTVRSLPAEEQKNDPYRVIFEKVKKYSGDEVARAKAESGCKPGINGWS
jgi:branched-chain amino acid transport system substrate-binding protein